MMHNRTSNLLPDPGAEADHDGNENNQAGKHKPLGQTQTFEELGKQLSGNLTIGYRECILKYMLNQPRIDQVFHAFGDPTRRKLIEQLSHGPASASDLAKPLGITLAAVVQHLQVLERSGVVRTQKVGRVRTCRIDPTGLNVAAEWIAERRSLWERRLDRLGDMLAEEAPPTTQATTKRGNT
jgi:DNA-binding transcriptional ArsR family regulator